MSREKLKFLERNLEGIKMARKTYTSTAVKARWNRKNYDRMAILIPKGDKEIFAEMAEKEYGMSMNGFINMQIRRMLGVSEEDWKPLHFG